jgi:hypothetical protein
MIGMFAGRGDVVLAMVLAFIIGFWVRHALARIKNPFKKSLTKEKS